MNTPKYELYETNHGIDGWDAKTRLVARFSTVEAAESWLAAQGYTYRQYGSLYHQDVERRHTMGCISYKIEEATGVPEDPAPNDPQPFVDAETAEACKTALAKLTVKEKRALGIYLTIKP